MNSSRTPNDHDEKRELLRAVFTLCLLDNALTRDLLDHLIVEARQDAASRVARLRPSPKGEIDFDVLGHVVYRWQRSPKYVDNAGNPLAIPGHGRAPSIEALFREIRRSGYFELGLRHLRQLGRIRPTRKGHFRPCDQVTIVQQLRPELLEL